MRTRSTGSPPSSSLNRKFINKKCLFNKLVTNNQSCTIKYKKYLTNIEPSKQQVPDRLETSDNTQISSKQQKYQNLKKFLIQHCKKLRIKQEKASKKISQKELNRRIRQIIQNEGHYTKQEIQKQIKQQLICYFMPKSLQQYQKVSEICHIFEFLKEEIDFSYVTSKYSSVDVFKIWLFQLVNHVYQLLDQKYSQASKKIPNYIKICKKIEQKIEKRNKLINHDCQDSQKSQIIEQKNRLNEWVELNNERPKCPIQECGALLEDRKCNKGQHSIVLCNQCAHTSHQCPQNTKIQFISNLNIKATGQRVDSFPISGLAPLTLQNNIKQVIKKQGYKFVSEQKIIKGVPKIKCFYPVLIGKSRDLVYKNRQVEDYLPLQIKQSKIKGAGLGVFATKNIGRKDVLVCSYMGEVGMGSQTPNEREGRPNDSIFTLGWIQQDILILAPNKYSNVGRYINFNKPQLCNLKPNLCLIQRNSNDYQIAVLLTTIRKIKAGQQLYYCYGQDYEIY